MKLIIDISEEAYNGIKMGMRNIDDMREVGEAIENGTPLEDIKAEIELAKKQGFQRNRKTYDECISIIDKYIGEEE